MKNYFEASYLNISFDERLDTVYCDWKSAPDSLEFRKGMLQIIEAMKEFRTGSLMSDTINIGTIHHRDQEWALDEWLEKAIREANYRQFAVIISSDLLAQMGMEHILTNVSISSNVEVRYFKSREKASRWLSETNKQVYP